MASEWTLWESKDGSVRLEAAFNPAVSRDEGFHLVLLQKLGVPSPAADPELFGRMAVIAGKVCAVVMNTGLADWANVHCDGNIGAAKGEPAMHIHIFGRLKSGPLWGGPLQLPAGEGPYGNEPLSQQEIERLRSALVGLF